MPSIGRRTLLRTCVVAAAAVAGCGDQPPDEPPTTARTERRPPADAEVRRLRYDGEPLVGSTREDGNDRQRTTFLVATEEERAALEYRTHPDGWRTIRTFVAETNLSKSALVIVQAPVGECYWRRLVSARRDDDGDPDVEFCDELRPATVSCERGVRVMEVLVVRLPFALQDPGGYSLGMGGNCGFRPTEGAE